MEHHKYPAVSHPQAQETRQDILERLRRYMEQWETEANKWEARTNELSASLNAERARNKELVDEIQHRARIDAEDTHQLQSYCSTIEHRLAETQQRIERLTPDGYGTPEEYIRVVNEENNLFTYQAAEARVLLREALAFVPSEFAARIRLILDTPEDAEKRERGVYQNSLGLCPRCGKALDNVAPGISVIAGGVSICTPCLNPGETELLRARSLT